MSPDISHAMIMNFLLEWNKRCSISTATASHEQYLLLQPVPSGNCTNLLTILFALRFKNAFVKLA